jgi:hypothetical protein
MVEIRSEVLEDGYRLRICRRSREGLLRKRVNFEPIGKWEEGVNELSPIASAAVDELTREGKLTEVDHGARLLGFTAAAALPNLDAEALNLLPPFPYQLEVQSVGTLGTPNFQIHYHATEGGIRIPGAFTPGMFTTEEKRYRIAGNLFSIIEKSDCLNRESGTENKIAHFAALRLPLPNADEPSNVCPENFCFEFESLM